MKIPPHKERTSNMLYTDNITKLLGLKDVIVKNVEESQDLLRIDIEMPRREHQCPQCGSLTDRVHDYRMQPVKDCPAFGKQVLLRLRKRRYVCSQCGKRFFEQNTFLPRYYRSTQRMILSVINSFRETVSATHIAAEHNISVSTAIRYFGLVQYGSYKLPRVLSLDEFKGNADGEKFQTIITDAEHHIVLDVFKNRKSADLIKYFLKFPRKERLKVKYVVMDMSSLFRGVAKVCFPNAKIVADRYHVVRQAAWAMENVRKRVQKGLSPEWRKYFKRSRYLLNKKPQDLTPEEQDQLHVILGVSSDLEYAYILKNRFVELMHSDNSEIGRKRLGDWVYTAECADLKEFEACTKALHNWADEIINSFDCDYTNGFTEGCNNKIKVIKRVSFGIPNFEYFRNRILHCSA